MDPYLGLTDCSKRIIDEEGWRALYRGWWLTMLAGVFGAFV
jgi:Mitochondrial carrier protein